ncbi:pilus assembly protein [Roseateles sp. So40a]|uniref:pilus assembly protein n=1 Tax=Roseateles sp. So40a TaxID=3400226 RepID=UPI003A878615
MNKSLFPNRRLCAAVALAMGALAPALTSQAQTTLANQPIFSSVAVPGNLALALSVEFPTAVSTAHLGNTYSAANTYLGYFDPGKCYDYVYSNTEADRYFQPAGATTTRTCNGKWSGNFMNWATMQTVDPFRWALTGGQRVIDTTTSTIIEKAWASGQGGTSNFPNRSLGDNNTISRATPLGWSNMNMRVQGLGNKMRFTNSGNYNSGTPSAFRNNQDPWDDSKVWEVSVRVKVCDPSTAAGGLESNCTAYGDNYKPEGLMQKYSQKIRFSAFGYLNDGALSRDGGVLRARQKFIGPTQPVPGSDPTANPLAEWSGTTGIMNVSPNPQDVLDMNTEYGFLVDNSGVMNYLNKFGASGSYKTYDPVGELYYAALRYYRNLGNVPEWTNPNTADVPTRKTLADGFPVITNWGDPILYSCQKNFILGIGDVNTHADRNVPGGGGNSEPTMPALVANDTAFDAVAWTNKVGALSGAGANIGNTQGYGGCCSNNGALMAGMAYWANSQDIRPTMDGKQTVKTYWLDVQEGQVYKNNNQFFLATRYGGANLPANWDASGTTDLTQSWWHTGPNTDTTIAGGGQLRPDTYYTASKADLMVSGLASAFASIASSIQAYTSSANTASNIVGVGTEAYGSSYDSAAWTGQIEANTINLLSVPVGYTLAWRFTDKLNAQLGTSGTGWDTARNIVTYKPTGANTGTGVAFRLNNLTTTQKNALNTTYVSGDDSQNFLNYVRGDRSNEENSLTSGSTKAYRVRGGLVADIINSQVVVVGPPIAGILSEASNPGYAAYVTAKSTRPNILVAGANSGLVHVINGSTTDATNGGRELFAFIPNAVITGAGSTPSVDGIAATGNPDFTHRYMVDARPNTADIDFNRTAGASGAPDWRTIVVGGLGKGGKSIYALDLTNADALTTAGTTASENSAASRVMWEYTETDQGYTFGTPVITKTAQYGWVVVIGSGYNNGTGTGFFSILNARTGALLQKIALPNASSEGSPSSPTGLTYLQTYYTDTSDYTVESIYAGDLKGNLWRLDLTATTGAYPAPTKLAKLTNAAGVGLPITSTPTPVINSSGNRRWIVVGTGQLLSTDDLVSTRANRIYAMLDGFQARPAISTDLPAGISMPYSENASRHDFQEVTTTSSTPLASNKIGYFIDLPTVGGGIGYEVVNEGDAIDSSVIISATKPSSTNACSPGGTSLVFLMDLNSGAMSIDRPLFAVDNVRFIGPSTGTGLTYLVSGKPSTSTPGGGTKDGDYTGNMGGSGTTNKKLINWREIPLRN